MFIQTKVDVLARLIAVASIDPHRVHIHGVRIRSRRGLPGVLVEATNGHIAAIEHDEGGRIDPNADNGRQVSAVAIKTILGAAKALAKVWRVDVDDFRVTICESGYELQCGEAKSATTSFPPPEVNPFLGFQFPDLERVIPKADEDAPPVLDCYNAKLLATLAGSARTVKRDAALTYCLYSTAIGSPARMKVAGAPNWLGVIMPMRGEMDGPAAPWERKGVDTKPLTAALHVVKDSVAQAAA